MGYLAVIAAAAVGLLLGSMYRVPALAAATALLIAICSTAGLAGEWAITEILLWAVSLTVTMQASYVAAVALARYVRSRRD